MYSKFSFGKVYLPIYGRKEVRALRGKNGPIFSQKLKVASHKNHPIGLLEE